MALLPMLGVLVLVVLVLVAPQVGAEQWTFVVHTKDAPPFSEEDGSTSVGYAIDLAEELVENFIAIADPGGQATINIVDGYDTNDQMIDAVVQGTGSVANFTLDLGAAATTVTAARENRVNFLPSYFLSGLQIMVLTATDLSHLIEVVVRNFLLTAALVVLAVIAVIYVCGAIAFVAEFSQPLHGKRPIFIEEGKFDYGDDMTMKEFLKNTVAEIKNAYMWTILAATGTAVGKPNSSGASAVRGFMGAFRSALFVISTATFTTVLSFSVGGADINSWGDLPGHEVCCVSNTTALDWVEDENNGFTIVEKPSIDAMVDGLFDGDCDAIIYDFPIIQYKVWERERDGKRADAELVGEILREEYYSIFANDSTPYVEDLKQAMITTLNDYSTINRFRSRWFQESSDAGGGVNGGVPVALIVVPLVLGVGILVIGIAFMWKNKARTVKMHTKYKKHNDMQKRNWERALQKLALEGDRDIIYTGTDDLVSNVALELTDVHKLLLRILTIMEPHEGGGDDASVLGEEAEEDDNPKKPSNAAQVVPE